MKIISLFLDDDRLPWLEELSHLADQSDKQIVLACSALKSSYRKLLTKNYDRKDCLIFMLVADRDVLEERIARRTGHYAKTSLLDSQLKTLEMPIADESNCVVIDAGRGNGVEELVERMRLIVLEI
jgi:carbohydrate kinase (thermoresistant glucokinase family)